MLAAVLLARDRHDRCVEHARRARALYRHTGHRLGEARALVILGHAPGAEAPRHLRDALEILADIGAHEADGVRRLLAGQV